MNSGLYIHIPFCASRCIYCDFYSTTGRNRTLFIDRLLEEADASLPHLSESIRTIYIGGGTPSQLTTEELTRLVDGLKERIDMSQVEEFTLEMNPEDVTPQYVAALPKEINRVSMGVQSFVDQELQLLRRRHNAQRPGEAIQLLRSHGISNISLDLMYGLPTQTLESFEYSIRQALALHPEHISAYNLSVEEGTPLEKMLEREEITLPDDDTCNKMNARLRELLSEAGYIQYEISNYALLGYHSRHNSSYWDNTPYLGLGPGAHSYDGEAHRWWNEPNLHDYLAGQCKRGEEWLTVEDRYNECIMLSLRTRSGIDIERLKAIFPSQYESVFLPQWNNNLTSFVHEGNRLRLVPEALSMADSVIRNLMV